LQLSEIQVVAFLFLGIVNYFVLKTALTKTVPSILPISLKKCVPSAARARLFQNCAPVSNFAGHIGLLKTYAQKKRVPEKRNTPKFKRGDF